MDTINDFPVEFGDIKDLFQVKEYFIDVMFTSDDLVHLHSLKGEKRLRDLVLYEDYLLLQFDQLISDVRCAFEIMNNYLRQIADDYNLDYKCDIWLEIPEYSELDPRFFYRSDYQNKKFKELYLEKSDFEPLTLSEYGNFDISDLCQIMEAKWNNTRFA